MTVYTCSPDLASILTCIYEAWNSRLGYRNVRLMTEPVGNLELFCDYCRIRLKQWKKIRRSVLITIRKSFTITWLAARQTGYMSFLHGTIFFQKKKERHFTRSRSFQEQLSRQRKSEEMIHVLAAAAKSTRSAVERMRNSR